MSAQQTEDISFEILDLAQRDLVELFFNEEGEVMVRITDEGRRALYDESL